jgi:hypothetical protein
MLCKRICNEVSNARCVINGSRKTIGIDGMRMCQEYEVDAGS